MQTQQFSSDVSGPLPPQLQGAAGLVLIVEDAGPVARVVQCALQRDAWRTETASTFAEATAKLRDHDPVVAIIDQHLPDGHGRDLIRLMAMSSAAGIIMMSGSADEVDRVVALELGADDFVAKPFSPREIAARVRSLARRLDMGRHRASVFDALAGDRSAKHGHSLGGASFDPGRLRVTSANGRVVRLTSSESKLLEMLLQAGGEPVEREDAAREALGWARLNPEQRSVDQLVCLLRRKLAEATEGGASIIAVRGRGYRLTH
jgi:DNA-binding response OmpR family regulator